MTTALLLATFLAADAAPTSPAEAPLAPAAAAELRLPRAGLDAGALAAPAVILAGLAGAALLLRRRRGAPGRRVQVLETTSLGPKRSLVLARLEDELLLLGASEAGIHLLRTRPAAGGEEAPAAAPAPARPAPERTAPAGLVARLRRARAEAAEAPAFDALLAESAEDQELRRKLARGQRGSVR